MRPQPGTPISVGLPSVASCAVLRCIGSFVPDVHAPGSGPRRENHPRWTAVPAARAQTVICPAAPRAEREHFPIQG